jgi:hypothetical protein
VVVLSCGASAFTSIDSLTDAGAICTSTTASWLSETVMPERTSFEKPASSTVTS